MSDKKGPGLMGAATAAALGAALGALGVTLSDEKKREELKKKMQDALTDAQDRFEELKGTAEMKVEEGRQMAADKLKEAADAVAEEE